MVHSVAAADWRTPSTYAVRLSRWCDETRTVLEYQDGRTIDGTTVRYPVILDAAGAPLVESVANPFQLWLATPPCADVHAVVREPSENAQRTLPV